MPTVAAVRVERDVIPAGAEAEFPAITDEAVPPSAHLGRGVLWGLCLSCGLWIGIFKLVSLLQG